MTQVRTGDGPTAPADEPSREPAGGALAALAGLVAGWAGLAVAWFAAHALSAKDDPVTAVAEQIIRRVPGGLAEEGIQRLGHHDKPVLVGLVLAFLTAVFVAVGWLSRRPWAPVAGFGALAVVGALAVSAQPGTGVREELPVAAGFLTWVGLLAVLRSPLREPRAYGDGRRFLLQAGVVAAGAAALGAVTPSVGRARRRVEAARSALRIRGLTKPATPAGADLGEALPWATPTGDFYRIDTAITPSYVDPAGWTLKIHGMVERPVEVTFEDLVARRRTNAWITLNCVSNEVGGDLIGNAWWSGVRLRDLLAEAGVQDGADAVLQTSADGWTCGTPMAALTDDRPAILALAMNGAPLPIEHGFPVRTVVPGLFGYVSACKWVVDLEVTTMSHAVGYWITRGWAAEGPVKLASRIDRPRAGATVPAGRYTVAGVAWEQETGISKVEVAVDGGAWREARLGRVPSVDTWVQWALDVDLRAGDHRVTVRAVDRRGTVQTSVRRDVVPDGATGWHQVSFEAS
ncbi:molybdopterin-dependent oxidoreductase [Nocardioides cheoyonin]|uniref:molybdopterin-dependent oxidoreductase n=1 Tax=Nocardioides cheoyonin TaxID=3156615 RepID=UPI0032B4F141